MKLMARQLDFNCVTSGDTILTVYFYAKGATNGI